MTNKKRVLLVAEAHFLSSGFGTYAKELLTRLHATGKYELAEFAAYGRPNPPDTPWLFYPNMPPDGDKEAHEAYNAHPSHQFGIWRFDKVCLDFKPDIVLSYRDPWMDEWIKHSPARPYFHWLWMPTVDSAPQRQEWVDSFASCDAVLSYSEFGGEVLNNQGKERINYIGCASPGIDPDIYKPMDTAKIRQEMGIDPDCFIVGTVMRNQKRKLFFELMKAFRLFLDTAPPEIAAKSFLYLHTSYPEKNGWDIADGIMQNKLGGKVMMTYICKNCKGYFGKPFQDAMTTCRFCGNVSAVCPTVAFGVPIEELAKIYNLFDLYAQYAICEGFGMPQVEAAACGVPVAATDYSAMYDVVRFTQGYPIPVRTFFREIETNAERAYPDNAELAAVMNQFFSLSDKEKMQKSMEVRKATISRYNWDNTAKVWEDYIDSHVATGQQGRWDAPPSVRNLPPEVPPNLSHADFIKFLFGSVVGQPELEHQAIGARAARDLFLGAEINQGVLEPMNQQKLYQQHFNRANNKNQFELMRSGKAQFTVDSFIIEARKHHGELS